MKNNIVSLALAGLVICASPALAARGGNGNNANPTVPAPTALRACALSDVSPMALACSGFFSGNLLSGSGGSIAAQQSALAAIGLDWDGDFASVTKIDSLNGLTTVDFGTADQNPVSGLYGDTWVGIHFGNGARLGGQATGFWKFDAGAEGLASFLLNIPQGSSGAVLYRTGAMPDFPPNEVGVVPEPATWAMMILGFGMVGASLRTLRAVVA